MSYNDSEKISFDAAAAANKSRPTTLFGKVIAINKKTLLILAAALPLSGLAVSSLVSANDSSAPGTGVGSEISKPNQSHKEQSELNISTNSGTSGGNQQSTSRQSINSETNTEVRVNDQKIPIKKNGVTKRTIKSDGGKTEIKVENHSTSSGSSTNFTTRNTSTNSNYSSSTSVHTNGSSQ